MSATLGRDKPTHGAGEQEQHAIGQYEYAPREIGAAFRGVFTGVGAVSEEGVPLAAPIGIEALFSSDIVYKEAY